jgi:glutamyl-tRNA synthetase
MKQEVRVRIAPSPTGYLHIGTARTALFNYLFAKKMGGKFLLRIEDTDTARNSESSYNSILNGLKFLGLNWDEEVIYQSKRIKEHLNEAKKLIENGFAYYCYLSPEEITRRKEEAEKNGTRYIHKYSKGDETPIEGVKPVIRMRVLQNDDIINDDLIQGKVVINSNTIEDFVIVRSDGTPVYMLSVVCDDIFMKITHILRGDDHLTNTPKQILIYRGLGAKIPSFGHIPLIHGIDGKKLSKRHGALAVEEYSSMGYLPEALRSYLVRLGWGSENDAILNDDAMIKEFDIKGISKSPSRFDFEKLKNINHHFINNLDEAYILSKIEEEGEKFKSRERLARAVSKIRYRYTTISDMREEFKVFEDDFEVKEDAKNLILENKDELNIILEFMKKNGEYNLEVNFKTFCKEKVLH